MTSRFLPVLAAPFAAVLMLGCSSGDPQAKSGAKAGTTPSAAGSPSPAVPGTVTTTAPGQPGTVIGGGNGASSAPTGGATASPGGGTSASATPPRHITLNAKLSKTCVKPGDAMTITMTARPKMDVIFNTRYPEGKEGKEFGGFESNGLTDEKGFYTKTWTVSPAVTPGEAAVLIAAVDKQGSGNNRLPFRVALSCP